MREGATVHHSSLDFLNWPIVGLNVTVLSWNWASFWEHMPGPTALYTLLTAIFMLFQMADKLGLLDCFKKRKSDDIPD